MRVCIIGGGKLGYYLTKTLLEHGHLPTVIEMNPKAAKELSNQLDIPVILGDGTNPNILKEASLEQCDACVCVSNKDEANLIAAQLAKKIFHVKKTVARVNNPKNTAALKKLGVDVAISSTYTLARILEREVETTAVRQLLSLGHGAASLVEIQIPDTFYFHGKTLTELPVPKGSIVISIVRKDSFLIPDGKTKILSGDKLMVAATEDALSSFIKQWKISDEHIATL